DRAATGDLPLPQSQLVSESQYFFELSHGQPFRGQCWFPPLTSGTLMPALLSSVLRPAPSRTVQGLWKSFRNDLGQGSGHRRKVTGLRSESVTGFIPESCPASFRNGARNDFGIVPGLPRNPHADGHRGGRRRLGREECSKSRQYCSGPHSPKHDPLRRREKRSSQAVSCDRRRRARSAFLALGASPLGSIPSGNGREALGGGCDGEEEGAGFLGLIPNVTNGCRKPSSM